MTQHCRVCSKGKAGPFISVEGRDYWRCTRCDATFLDPSQLPDADAERARYDLHNNQVDDPNYRDFLWKVCAPLLECLPAAQEGLDYGCGPGPALAQMLTEAGHRMRLYDPFFHPDPAALDRTYDFVTCTEAAEHFHDPQKEFTRLDRLVRTGGWLAFMTSFQIDDAAFADWHYRRDLTHVAFYRETTFHRLARQFGWECKVPVKNVALMRKARHVN